MDFRQVAAAALASLDSLLRQWLPDGKQQAGEWVALNPTRVDGKAGSFRVNLRTGRWADFATDDKGGDAISLLAYLQGIPQAEAAKQLAEQLRVDVPARSNGAHKPPPAPRTEWAPVVPVPTEAPEAPAAHEHRGLPVARWTYRDREGRLLGYVCRFTTSDGGKEILPLVYADRKGTRAWRWLQWREPRPLYGLEHLRAEGPVLVVEGEKCADAAREAVGHEYSVITWPGGSKAVDKADWSHLEGRQVVIWPDADAQTGKDGMLLPAEQQPGVRAAHKVAELLAAIGARTRILDVGQPGERPGGWDVADAIAEGWSADQVLDFIRAKQRSVAAPQSAPDPSQGWRDQLLRNRKGELIDCRENVYLILRDHPEWKGVIGLDQFSNRIVKRRPTPWGLEGEWTSVDDLQLGVWTAQQLGLVIKAAATLGDGVQLAAIEAPFHPVREWLRGLKWDGVERLDSWLVDFLNVQRSKYVELVGRYFLTQMVARVFRPGCKADCSLILEGPQGRGKSTVVAVLGGEWSSDTPFVVGDKDSFQALSGVWVYEISELDSFNRSETTRVKAFISSPVDRYRAPYERRPAAHPRQCVFISTTNQHEYLQDTTGNRRFWPVSVGDEIAIDALAAARDLLFAEAVHCVDRGDRWFPTREEQLEHFAPEQAARENQHPWEFTIRDFLDRGTGGPRSQVTVAEILYDALKFEPARISHSNTEAKRVGAIMARLGWRRLREGSGARNWYYERPKEGEAALAVVGEDNAPF